MDLRREVELLARPEGRVPGTPGHERARRHLDARLHELGLVPYRGDTFALPYRAAGVDFCNLLAVAPGLSPGAKPVLIGAHYDSIIEAACADDNAAAVALALAAGAHFREQPAQRDVVLALFDGEEPPWFQSEAMGSIRFYQDQRRPEGFHAAVVMDLVGHDVPLPSPELGMVVPHFARLLFVTGAESHPALPGVVRSTRVEGLPVVATLNRRVGDMSDHGVFRRAGVPYLFLSCGRWEHYHRPTDTPGRLNYAKMASIGEYLRRLVAGLAEAELPQDKGGDTTAFEIELLREALGPTGVQMLTAAVGLPRLATVADLDALAARLQAYFEL